MLPKYPLIFSLVVCVCLQILLLIASLVSSAIVEHSFAVGDVDLHRLCGQVKYVVNGNLPGPTIEVREGDTLIVHVINKSPHNITLHWHGVFQLFSGWADGTAYVTQCPIAPGSTYTYRFNIAKQEGTLWWHAHISMLRETLYGALIIRPKLGRSYPFPNPFREVPILIGEWWHTNILDVEREFVTNGGGPRLSDAFTINGQPGALYPCSSDQMFRLDVIRGKTYLLRMVNVALSDHFFFKIVKHTFTVVAIDARYTEPYNTDVIVLAPGQSADVLFTADQHPRKYYMASRPYSPTLGVDFPKGTATGIVQYINTTSSTKPQTPTLPNYRDTETAHNFYTSLKSLTEGNPHWEPVPQKVDQKMFITFGLGVELCGPQATCTNPLFGSKYRYSSTMNNISFQFPTKLSMLEAFHNDVNGIYTEDFPDHPLVEFNYTDPKTASDMSLLLIEKKETRVKRLKYNSVVDIVLQSTVLVAAENHPMHFHGFDFYVLGQGFGNYDPINDPKKFNLVNPQERNTIAVPIGGWAAIRFRANNPGVWFVHCHRETHVPWGLNMAFIIENGPTLSTSLPPPPPDLPRRKRKWST